MVAASIVASTIRPTPSGVGPWNVKLWFPADVPATLTSLVTPENGEPATGLPAESLTAYAPLLIDKNAASSTALQTISNSAPTTLADTVNIERGSRFSPPRACRPAARHFRSAGRARRWVANSPRTCREPRPQNNESSIEQCLLADRKIDAECTGAHWNGVLNPGLLVSIPISREYKTGSLD